MSRRRKRHSPEQIVRMLRDADAILAAGKTIGEVCQALEVSEQTFHRWRHQYGGMKAEEAKRLKKLEEENKRLKRCWPRRNSTRPFSVRCWRETDQSCTPQGGGGRGPAKAGRQRTSGVQDLGTTTSDATLPPAAAGVRAAVGGADAGVGA
jgi:transposase-like protein